MRACVNYIDLGARLQLRKSSVHQNHPLVSRRRGLQHQTERSKLRANATRWKRTSVITQTRTGRESRSVVGVVVVVDGVTKSSE